MKLHELIAQGAKFGRQGHWPVDKFIKLGTMAEMNLEQYQIDATDWEEFDINSPKCYCEAFESVPEYLKDYYKKRVLVIDNPCERVDMVLNNMGEYTLCLVGEDEGHSKPIKFCPFCGRKLA